MAIAASTAARTGCCQARLGVAAIAVTAEYPVAAETNVFGNAIENVPAHTTQVVTPFHRPYWVVLLSIAGDVSCTCTLEYIIIHRGVAGSIMQ